MHHHQYSCSSSYEDQDADILIDIIRENPEELSESLVNLCRNLMEQSAAGKLFTVLHVG